MIPEILRINILNFFSVPVYSFGLMILCCFIGAMKLLEVNLIKNNKDPALAEPMITIAAISGILGARIFSIFSNFSDFLSNPLSSLLSTAGFVYYGGFIGGVLGVILYLKYKCQKWPEYANIVAAPLAFGYAIGRLGCQLSGDGDYGHETDFFFSMNYIYGVIPTERLVHPTPFYESILALAITLVLSSSRIISFFGRQGQLFGLYLLLTSLSRFFIEFLRVEPIVFLNLTQAQIFSILLLPMGIFLMLIKKVKV